LRLVEVVEEIVGPHQRTSYVLRRLRIVIDVPADRFEELVADALDSIPPELGELVDNVVVIVEEGTPDGDLGLYEGIPLTERDGWYGTGDLVMPDG
jgi:predicted Zn-dependent protease with MMP-like domain